MGQAGGQRLWGGRQQANGDKCSTGGRQQGEQGNGAGTGEGEMSGDAGMGGQVARGRHCEVADAWEAGTGEAGCGGGEEWWGKHAAAGNMGKLGFRVQAA